ncbi:MAG: hypothetical protein IKM43_04175 [Clostridia bacterium]|nr:hypothetical protein [Clostridia bacterium]
MAIYKSSFNKKPEKKEKKEKPEKEIKVKEQKTKVKKKVNVPLITLIVFSVLFLVCILPSNFLKNFLLGIFGLLIYPVTVVGAFLSTMIMRHKKYNIKKRYIIFLSCALFIIWFIFHLILTSKVPLNSFGAYIKGTYKAKTTAGGIIFSLLSYPIVKLLTTVGAYIFSAITLAIFVGLIIDYINVERTMGTAEKKSKFDFKNIEEFNFEEQKQEPVSKEEHAKRLARRKLGLEKGETTVISSSMPTFYIENKMQTTRPISKREYILTPLEPVIPPEDTNDIFNNTASSVRKETQTNNFQSFGRQNAPQQNTFNKEEIKPVEQVQHYTEPAQENKFEPSIDDLLSNEDEYDDLIVEEDESLEGYEPAFEKEMTDTDQDETEGEEIEIDLEDLNEDAEETENYEEIEITPDLDKQDYVDEYAYNKDQSDLGSSVETEVVRPSVDITKFNLPNQIKKPVGEEEIKPEVPKQKLEIPPYVTPPVDLLNYMENPARISDEELQDNIDRLEQVLEDFKVPAKVNNVQVGPAVTRYELTMPRGISVNKIAQMADDIAMTLASNGSIRVEAPIPGKNSVGIEVPNAQVSPVSLRELVDSEEFRQRGNPLSFVLGKDINGDIIFCNLDKMPHLLVAGSTGSGKSVCLNTMLLSMCYKAGPQDLRLILVDPKMVEFTTYNGLPHLLIPEVIIGKDLTINALDWAIKEMERRYALFAKNHVVNINEFNKSDLVRTKQEEKLPFIVIVVDELADLMLEAKREIEDRIAKLAAKARAAGIHLVLATQRPSVDVITGTVKANLPSRVAFALTNYMDSKTVLDGGGAEKLLGKGDMLFKPQDKPEPRRVQGAYVSNAEIAAVVEFIKNNNKPVYDDDAGRAIKNPHAEKQASAGVGARDMEFDPVLKEALRMFIQTKQASGSMISRRYSVGFNRAGRIMDQMERAGFIGPQEGSKPRTVLITMDEYNAIFGEE